MNQKEKSEAYDTIKDKVSILVTDIWHSGLVLQPKHNAYLIDLMFTIYYEKDQGIVKLFSKN